VRLAQACLGQPLDRPPVWFLRQTGRVLPEYRTARKHLSLDALYADADLSSRLSLLPVERFRVDAAVVATDIRLPLVGMGLLPSLAEPEQPVGPQPEATPQPRRWRPATRDDFGQLAETTRLTVRALEGRSDVLGVVGAPFTLAASAFDPAALSQAPRTKALVLASPERWEELASALTGAAMLAAELQVSAGADVLHVFDTWAGALDEPDYRTHVLPWSRRLFEAIGDMGVPAIHYGLGTERLAEAYRDAGGDVIGIDARLPIDAVWARLGTETGVQGNLDPTLLTGPPERAIEATSEILARTGNRPGHVFGLSHGLLPSTSPSALHLLVRYVESCHL
jgi:uroporphyrinogen decarboxylase